LAVAPLTKLNAMDFRKEKPDTWTAKTPADALKVYMGILNWKRRGYLLRLQNLQRMVERYRSGKF